MLDKKSCKVRSRYGEGGIFKERDFTEKGINQRAAATLSKLVNSSRSTNSWRQDDAVQNVVDTVSVEWGIELTPPWSTAMALTFVAACAEKNLRAETVRQYISSIKTRHRQLSMSVDGLEGYMLNAAIMGIAKSQPEKTRFRGAITPQMLRILKEKAYLYANNLEDEATLWLVCTLLFHCALRGSEILAARGDEIVENKTMLWSALRLECKTVGGKEEIYLRVEVKGQKQIKGNQTQVLELYEMKTDLCPIAALRRVLEVAINPKEGPVARWSSGIMITTSFMNKFLKETLQEHVDWDQSTISTHSFRAGLPTLLTNIGEKDNTIQDVGRWKSTAYKLYQKEGSRNVAERLKLFRRIGAAMS